MRARVALASLLLVAALAAAGSSASALTVVSTSDRSATPRGQSYVMAPGDQFDFKAPVRRGSMTVVSFGGTAHPGVTFHLIDPSGRVVRPRLVDNDGLLPKGVVAVRSGRDGYAVSLSRTTPGIWKVRIKYQPKNDSDGRLGIGWSSLEDINLEPIVSWGATVTGPLRVSIDASLSRDPEESALSFAWDFGDGSRATGEYASHVYKKPGTYTITGTVRDADGASVTLSESVVVDAGGKARPIAALTARIIKAKGKTRAAVIRVNCARFAVTRCEIGTTARTNARGAKAQRPRIWGVVLAPGRSKSTRIALPRTSGRMTITMRARDGAQRAGGATTARRSLVWS